MRRGVPAAGPLSRAPLGSPMRPDRAPPPHAPDAARGWLDARPATDRAPELPPGLHPLGLGGRRDALLYVPAGLRGDQVAPFVVLLHGSGADARAVLPVLAGLADAAGLVVLAPDSRGRTWDALLGGFGPDVAFLERALAAAFERVTPDPARLAVAGFSNGGSYALGLARGNGDLFTHCVAFSPGYVAATVPRGRRPRVFVSHGRRDAVLPIDLCSRRFVSRLRDDGHEVRYDEFGGGHTVPAGVARAAVEWMLG